MKLTVNNTQHTLHTENLPAAIKAGEILHNNKRDIQGLSKEGCQGFIDLKKERNTIELELRNMLFTLSLCISLILVITAMNWKFYDKGELLDLGTIDDDFETLTEIPISNQPPPPPPPKMKLENLTIVEVENEQVVEDLEVNLDIEVTQDDILTDVVYDDLPVEVMEEEVEEIFQIVENKPEPVGGLKSFYSYIAENMDYPDLARRLGVSGVVYVKFVVEKNGSITDVNILKGIGAGCDEEAARVVHEAPAWIPGKQRGKAVRVYMTVPIRFVLHVE